MPPVRVLYFAALRDLVGLAEEQVELAAESTSLEDFAAALVARHPVLDGRLASTRFAVNEAFASGAHVVRPGDSVALIPPVSGG